ncbi:hypothetical protein L3X38_044620 [Prunus dulcis]|uniref:Uncharacterized protein n=1 Tax=Prunus dulcis TaxID=3755 RepID=A0AAD4YNL3_PRUDU|nr:hypothetical protein L3X38_044620 [Prunus dulcis]
MPNVAAMIPAVRSPHNDQNLESPSTTSQIEVGEARNDAIVVNVYLYYDTIPPLTILFLPPHLPVAQPHQQDNSKSSCYSDGQEK